MLTIPVGDGVCSWGFRTAGDPETMYCTIGVRPVVGPFDAAHLFRLEECARLGLLPRMSNEYSLVETTVRIQQDGGGSSVFTRTPVSARVGAVVDSAMAPNCAVLIEKRTILGGRRGTGRMFVPGVPQGEDDSAGRLAASRIGNWTSTLGVLLAKFTEAAGSPAGPAEKPLTPLLFHGNATTTTRTRSGGTTTVTVTEGAAGPSPTTITGFTVDALIATQRRRMR